MHYFYYHLGSHNFTRSCAHIGEMDSFYATSLSIYQERYVQSGVRGLTRGLVTLPRRQ